MNTIFALAVVALSATSLDAFAPSTAVRGLRHGSSTALRMGYVPDGLSPDEWKKIQAKEKQAKTNLGRVGPNRFKSRSFQAWQESGAGHLFPVDPRKVKSGEVKAEDVPYMQRGGAWDDSDIKNVKKKAWSQTDKAYDRGGFRKEQSVSIFGGANLPWNQKYQKMDKDAINPIARQKNWKRPGSVVPMSSEVKARLAREEAEAKRKKEAQLKKELQGEKKGLFGMW
ncbi:unnamed protein product [Discosporangium mesarthrocarpum]